MKVSISSGKKPGELAARFRAVSWQRAHLAINLARMVPPPGYKLTAGSVRDEDSGARVDVMLVFRHIDGRHPPLTEDQLREDLDPIFDAALRSDAEGADDD